MRISSKCGSFPNMDRSSNRGTEILFVKWISFSFKTTNPYIRFFFQPTLDLNIDEEIRIKIKTQKYSHLNLDRKIRMKEGKICKNQLRLNEQHFPNICRKLG